MQLQSDKVIFTTEMFYFKVERISIVFRMSGALNLEVRFGVKEAFCRVFFFLISFQFSDL